MLHTPRALSRLRARAVALVAAVIVAGCGGAARPAPPTLGATNGHGAAATGWLVWREGPTPRTVWLDDEGVPRGEAEGLLVGAAGRVWSLEVSTHPTRLLTCDQLEDAGAAHGADAPEGAMGRATSAHARAVGSVEARTLVPASRIDPGTFAEFDESIEFVGALGPLVFARRHRVAFACGAHGDTEVTALVFDLARGVALDPAAFGGDDPSLEAAAAQALAAAPGAEAETDAPTRVAVEPRLGGGGLHAVHAFVTEACYACGDGRWSSYTRLAEVESATLPAAWVEHAQWPARVQAWIAAHPGVLGVSRAIGDEAALAARLE